MAQVTVRMILGLRCMPDRRHVELAFVLSSITQAAFATAADHFAGERVAEVLQVRRLKQFHVSLLRKLGELAFQLVAHIFGTDVTEVFALLFTFELFNGIVQHLEIGWWLLNAVEKYDRR